MLLSDAQLPVVMPDGHTEYLAITSGLARVLHALSDAWALNGHRATVCVLEGDLRIVLPDGTACSPLGWLAMQTVDTVPDDDPTALADILGMTATETYAMLCASWGALDDVRRGKTLTLLLALRQELERIFT